MRKIKFRGKSVSNNQWVYGYLVPRSVLEEPHYLEELWIATGFENECYPVAKDSVCEFISLLDINENEIYEGDVLIDNLTKNKFEVKFIEGGFRHFQIGLKYTYLPTTLNNHDITLYKLSIIGNTTDTPELITV